MSRPWSQKKIEPTPESPQHTYRKTEITNWYQMRDLDRATISALRRGEEWAYTQAADQLLGPVYGFLVRLTRDPSAAEDLAQETFLAVWRKIDSFEGRSQFITWVFGIAYRQFLQYRRRPGIETVELDEARDRDDSSDPLEIIEADDERREVQAALRGLPVIYREVVGLVYMSGLSYKAAAEVLGIKTGTAKSRANTALRLLRERLCRREVMRGEVQGFERT